MMMEAETIVCTGRFSGFSKYSRTTSGVPGGTMALMASAICRMKATVLWEGSRAYSPTRETRVEGSWFFSQMKVHRAIFSLSQRLIEIGDEIARIFQSHRDAH